MTTDTATAMLRGALVPTLVVGTLCLVVWGLVSGAQGAVGALAGLALVVVFFALGLIVLRRCARLEPTLVLLVAMGLYTAKVVLIGGSLLYIQASGLLDDIASNLALGVTAIACTLAWSVGQIVGFVRAREPIFDIDEHGDAT